MNGITKASVYTVTGSKTVGALGSYIVVANCRDINDVLLHGGCSIDGNGVAWIEQSTSNNTNTDNLTVPAEWDCKMFLTTNTAVSINAYAVCLITP